MGFHRISSTRNVRTPRAHLDRKENGDVYAVYKLGFSKDALRDFAEYRVALRVSEFANADKVSVGDSLWHDGSEKPQTGRIMFESTDGGSRFADYDHEIDRFDSDDECYYSGTWERCHIKRWMYEKDLLNL